MVLGVSSIALLGTCISLLFDNPAGLKCACWIYVPGVLFLLGLYTVRFLLHPFREHEVRLVDRTEAEALFEAGKYVLQKQHGRHRDAESRKALLTLIESRRAEGAGTWTEYRVLPVEQAAVSLLPVDDLVARAYARLDDLKEYDEKRSDAEKDYFEKREKRLRKSIEAVNKLSSKDKNKKVKKTVAALRAELKMLLETLADYDKNWAIGSEILRALLIVVSFTVPILLLMGIAPALIPPMDPLGFVNWAMLGTAGSLTAVLRKLYLGNKVEVGDTEGKNELYQAIKGAILGFVSAILLYAMLWGGLVQNGAIVPDVTSGTLVNINLSVFWAVMTGFAFEHFFDRVQRDQIWTSN